MKLGPYNVDTTIARHYNSLAVSPMNCHISERKRFSECLFRASKNKIVTLSPLSQSCVFIGLDLFSLLLKSLLLLALMIDSFDLAVLVDIIITTTICLGAHNNDTCTKILRPR